MSYIWVLIAFVFGFVARQVGLPPLVGYLSAGFVLHAVGFQAQDSITQLADLGITLMLFTIGLKVNPKELLRVNIWGSALSHMSVWILVLIPIMCGVAVIAGSALLDIPVLTLALILFALSFSSTVCVIKILDDHAELKTRHSDLVINILIIQDLVAVIFLVVATGKLPSLWALALLPLAACRPLLNLIFQRSGHGELLALSGFCVALGGASLFELVDLKGDLGALAAGMLLAGLPKSSELYKSLMSFKDLFLIGFFLSIGFAATPTLDMWLIALGISLLLPLKFVLFFMLFSWFGFRGRTSFLSSLLLANFSEFGLIVASISVEAGWLSSEWLVILALSTAISFLLTSVVYKNSHSFYARRKSWVKRFEGRAAKSPNNFIQPKNLEVLIVGMGRVGLGAYEVVDRNLGERVWGLEVSENRADYVRSLDLNGDGRKVRVLTGDADDIEFWEQLDLEKIKLIMLAIPSTIEMKNIIFQLKSANFTGCISTLAQYEDERETLIKLGANVAFNYFSEVGSGFAEESLQLIR